MSDIKTILSTIEDAVNELSKSAAAKQPAIYKKIIELIKDLDTRGDTLLNNINNFKKIVSIKSKLERFIIDQSYKQDIKTFVEAYGIIANLQNNYFSKFNEKFKPQRNLKALTAGAIESTINGLTEVGLEVGVTDPLKKMLFENVKVGGSYSELTDKLREFILTDKNSDGVLEKHVKTFSTTAINQFSALYNKSIADDLALTWFMYDGSLIETSRPFCIKAVAKKYIHISEFETILKGDFGELGKVHINKTTDLPDGLLPGTDASNFPQRRGGYSCGHQLIAVDDVIVPQSVKDKVYATFAYKTWSKRK